MYYPTTASNDLLDHVENFDVYNSLAIEVIRSIPIQEQSIYPTKLLHNYSNDSDLGINTDTSMLYYLNDVSENVSSLKFINQTEFNGYINRARV